MPESSDYSLILFLIAFVSSLMVLASSAVGYLNDRRNPQNIANKSFHVSFGFVVAGAICGLLLSFYQLEKDRDETKKKNEESIEAVKKEKSQIVNSLKIERKRGNEHIEVIKRSDSTLNRLAYVQTMQTDVIKKLEQQLLSTNTLLRKQNQLIADQQEMEKKIVGGDDLPIVILSASARRNLGIADESKDGYIFHIDISNEGQYSIHDLKVEAYGLFSDIGCNGEIRVLYSKKVERLCGFWMEFQQYTGRDPFRIKVSWRNGEYILKGILQIVDYEPIFSPYPNIGDITPIGMVYKNNISEDALKWLRSQQEQTN
jgi:hypothetical protein